MMKIGLLSITSFLGLLCALLASADTLPLERGFYVIKDTPCQQASNATITLYTGISFGQAHLQCKDPVSQKLANGSYRIEESCQDMQGRGAKWKKAVTDFAVLSETEFTTTNSYGNFSYRYCRQADLPSPWNAVDLSSLGAK